MKPLRKRLAVRAFVRVVAAALLAGAGLEVRSAHAGAMLLVEADSGRVLAGENATYPWYPASVTKLMTTYVTFKAIRDGRITLDSVFTVSPNAVAQQPSKMGFRAGTQLTVDNTLKMLLVHSANDMAVVLAEGVAGSIEKFSDEMNAAARQLGMTQTSYVNPNGLPDDEQITSARDLAILARALIHEFPEYDAYWHIPSIRLGKRIYGNTNRLIDSYAGADGMKTGFICASGFNLVATATRGNRRLIAVVLGAPSSAARAMQAAELFERGFAAGPLSWLSPSRGTVDSLVPIDTTPPNLRDEICGNHRRHAPTDSGMEGVSDDPTGQRPFSLSSLHAAHGAPVLTSGLAAGIAPVDVYVGPKRNGFVPDTDVADAPVVKKKKTDATAKLVQEGKSPQGSKPAAKPVSPSKSATTAKATRPAPGSEHAAVHDSEPKNEPKSDAKGELKTEPKAKPAMAAATRPKPPAIPKSEATPTPKLEPQ